ASRRAFLDRVRCGSGADHHAYVHACVARLLHRMGSRSMGESRNRHGRVFTTANGPTRRPADLEGIEGYARDSVLPATGSDLMTASFQRGRVGVVLGTMLTLCLTACMTSPSPKNYSQANSVRG